MKNFELAHILRDLSDCYKYLGKDQRFRAVAYAKAARTVQDLKTDIGQISKDIHQLEALDTIGESIAAQIVEYLKTGRIERYEELKKKIPVKLLPLMEISGMGPESLRTLHEKLGVNDPDDLAIALKTGKIRGLKGFGQQRIENLKRALKIKSTQGNRMLLDQADRLAEELVTVIRSLRGIHQAEIAGSLRRRKETIGDIDIIASAKPPDAARIIRQFIRQPFVKSVLAAGNTKASIILHEDDVQADLRVVEPEAFGAAWLYLTGSKDHNIRLRTLAKKADAKLSEYGWFDARSNQRIAGSTETGIYQQLDMLWIPPELREDTGEIEASARHRLPDLISDEKIKGDMHVHSDWSDGLVSVEELAQFVLQHFPQYEYVIVSDHSPAARIANGLQPEQFLHQFAEIERVNQRIGRSLIKKGVEVDILLDGSLDLDDRLLEQFDWVTASIHSHFSGDQTRRLISACRHPWVNTIGHPSGRLIGKREGYTLDRKKLFEAAAETGTCLEINAQPQRIDLRDHWIREARDMGVRFSLGTDAHTAGQMKWMWMATATARRGWCTEMDAVNVMNWSDIMELRHK